MKNVVCFLFILSCTIIKAQNLALNKPTSQSSTWYSALSSKVVDGNTNGNYSNVGHTQNEPVMWWKVNLENQYRINHIKVFNRTDDVTYRIVGAQVYVGNSDTANLEDYTAVGNPLTDQPITEINNVDLVGQYVMVRLVASDTDVALALAEVEIYGFENSNEDPPVSGETIWSTDDNHIFYNQGNVGIGINNPDSKLSVNGDIRAKEVKVETVNWPDYVFSENYNLPSLSQVKDHIKKKGHLINIPSAQIIEKKEIELGEMNRLLLEKIEELTLYILQHEKNQKKIISELKLLKAKIK